MAVELERLSQSQFDRFRDFIYGKSGIRVQDNKLSLLSNRIRRRLKAGEFDGFEAYYRFLISSSGRAELEHFIDEITTNETFFFRTVSHFEWFKDAFIPEAALAHRKGRRSASLRKETESAPLILESASPASMILCRLSAVFLAVERAFPLAVLVPVDIGLLLNNEFLGRCLGYLNPILRNRASQ